MVSGSGFSSSGDRFRVVRFSVFDLDLAAGELRRQGIRVRLQPKPMQILTALLESPGQLVTREELKVRLWPEETFVDFESGLNTAVNRLRIALGDSAEHPRYIATEARAGYRFIAPVQLPSNVAPAQAQPTPTTLPEPELAEPAPPLPHRRFPRRLALVALALLSLIAVAEGIRMRQPAPRISFRQITFRRGQVSGARFGDGARTILYAARWESEPRRIFQAHVGDPVSRTLGFEDLSLAAVSHQGQLALLRSGGTMNIRGGTLYRVNVDGGPLQQVAENIFAVDWSPDGKSLAVVRVVAGEQQLEYPVGQIRYHTSGWLSNVRISPDGDEVAFVEHPVRHEDAGSIRYSDGRGHAVTLSDGWASVSGLAWRNRDEMWFSAARDSTTRSVWAVTKDRKLRSVGQAPGILTLRDIAPGGAALLSVETRRLEMAGAVAGETPEKSFSLTDWSRVQQISHDGSLLLFDESGEGVGWRPVSYVRKTRTGEVIRLRDGFAQGFDQDASAAFVLSEDRTRLWRVPVGGGAAQPLPSSGLTYQWARPFPGGRRLLALANLPRQPLRLYVQTVANGSANPLTGPVVVRNASASADGTSVAILTPEEKLLIYPTGGGSPRELASDEPLAPIRWSNDGEWLFVMHLRSNVQSSANVSRIRVATGEIVPWKVLKPADTIGVNSITGLTIADDEKSYVYSYRRVLSSLYLAEGWK
jgi:DNA-binding winged helix-turn-helix (wHTH) protein